MLNKLFSFFSKNKSIENPQSKPDSEFTSKNNLNENNNVTFQIDFISIRDTQEKITNAIVSFPEDSQYIIINGEKEYFDAYKVENEGKSSDNKYYRIATSDFKFWVLPKDKDRFMSILNHRHQIKMKRRQEKFEHFKEEANTPFSYDEITDDIYICFIAFKSGLCEAIGTWEKYDKVEAKISELCQAKGGKFYKSEAKSAKFAIIFSPNSRLPSNINGLKQKGYKVTTFEKALKYMGIEKMWDCKTHAKFADDFQKDMTERYS